MPDRTPREVQSGSLLIAEGDVRADPAPPERPRGLLRQLEKTYLYADRILGQLVPESLNPLIHSGAIAVTTFLIATVTGVILLLWYRPSVHMAYASVEAMSDQPLLAGLLRSLHRYSSDACMLFAVLHGLRTFFERRFGGARWLAWVTGITMIGVLWFIGWTGYWLVWDLRAQSLALGTARALDVLPIFVDPLSRSFLTDEGVNSLLFFVVFFIHMLIPLGMGLVMWLHITRLARSRFLTDRPMTVWVSASLLLLCAVYPAQSAAPAMMAALPQDLTMDWFYLAPLFLTDRLGGGTLWALVVVASPVLFSVPWWLARRTPAPATVVASRCNECQKCYHDCPYEAIQMVPRSDGNPRHLTQASVIPSKCVGCGICAGSCDTAGIGVDWLSAIDQRRRIEAWMKEAESSGESVSVAFLCAESAGGAVSPDPSTGRCDELPGYRAMTVPCAGWVHPLLIERALRHGAAGVLLASCGPAECLYREGGKWERQRLAGEREPALRTDKLDPLKVRLVELDRTRKNEFLHEAKRFRAGEPAIPAGGPSGSRGAVAASLLAFLCAGLLGVISDLGYAAPHVGASQLVVSLKHPGAVSENCRDLSEEELSALPVHMRTKTVCERMRAHVRLRVAIDGATVVETSVPPSGIWEDGNSITVERIPVEPGEHRVSVAIGETTDPDEWSFRDESTLTFSEKTRRVVMFDRLTGFRWN